MTINDNDKWMQKLIGGQVEIVPFYKSTHIVDTVNVLLNVCKTDPSYPPLQDAKRTPESFADWLIREPVLSRWVATVGGEVIGHIAIANPHLYIMNFLNSIDYDITTSDKLGEIIKFFVHPAARQNGVGESLLAHALISLRNMQLQPVLAVVSDSRSARRLYAHIGMKQLGYFEGIHGLNFVFTDEKAKFLNR